ncbi:dNTP triphosphohydrolase [Treponema vincentii]|uniref:dGTP triphosphohydrolase n=1 Tax=Treponema vincentii TaxID=69710 RepID=UPI0020A5A601|nr:dNTP triphosphohydrolase [Treponema vincentii]UTC60083.1 dNTP triphosphohydrolase [Treponema vincentii]
MDWAIYLNEDRLRRSVRNKENDNRNEFESDYGRVIFSPAIRRMHDKTQVMPLTHDDNIHTRLTHSLEVMSVAYSIGIRLIQNPKFQKISGQSPELLIRKIPLILQAAAVVHDVGNPPFGHLGETSISDFFESYFKNHESSLNKSEREDFTKFDGNAQGFRILTKLQILDDLYGLNLTKATLGAYLKYPNYKKIDKNKIGRKKRGVFQSEKKYLDIVAKDTGMKHGKSIIRHPLSFLVEAADNICYRVMDIEDGFNKKWFSFDKLVLHFKDSEIGENLVTIQKDKKGNASKITAFRLLVMNKLITTCINNFLINIDKITCGEYDHELIEDEDKCKVDTTLDTKLKEVCQKWIFPKREVVSMELKGDAVIKGLLNKYTEFIIQKPKKYLSRALPLISNSIVKTALMENGFNSIDDFDKLSEYFKLRVIVDYISGMTDQYALSQFRILHG